MAEACQIFRRWMDNRPTMGLLSYGDFTLYTLEDPWRDNRIGVSCIPLGKYPLVIDVSNRFQRPMPHLLDVPNRTGIRIHPGNNECDTEGCILLGLEASDDQLWYSRSAFRLFYKWLEEKLLDGPVECEVKYAP